ncbi:hypothetical protein H0H92_002339 [Tricholoma furcatifolium]|nr:hypothetical protein H0H92_002339 [Tricholoma furcatifolium]
MSFSNNNNIEITGGRFYNVAGDQVNAQNVSINQNNDNILNKLWSAEDAGRIGSKACLEGTRVALLKRISDWALDPTGPRALLLTGAAGMGKSAVAHTIARHLENSGAAIVPFFCI